MSHPKIEIRVNIPKIEIIIFYCLTSELLKLKLLTNKGRIIYTKKIVEKIGCERINLQSLYLNNFILIIDSKNYKKVKNISF